MSDAAALREALGPTAGELVRLLPGLPAMHRRVGGPVDADPDTERHRLHTAVADLLAAIGRARPLVLVHRGRALGRCPSLGLLRHLVRRAAARACCWS